MFTKIVAAASTIVALLTMSSARADSNFAAQLCTTTYVVWRDLRVAACSQVLSDPEVKGATHANYYFWRGKGLEEDGRDKDALADFEMAHRLGAGDEAVTAKCRLLRKLGKTKDAADHCATEKATDDVVQSETASMKALDSGKVVAAAGVTKKGSKSVAADVSVWKGHYYCRQGLTQLTVEIRRGSNGLLTGLFTFGPPPGRNGESGAYEFRVLGSGEEYVFEPLRWVRQPAGYAMVGARLRAHGKDFLSGQIQSSSCGKIELRRLP